MSKKREILLKFIIVLGVIFSILSLYFGYHYEFKKETEYEVVLIISFSACCISAFLVFFLGSYKVKPPKPNKYYLRQKTYEELSEYIESRVKEYSYELYYGKDNIRIYEKIEKRKSFYIIDARVDELTEENLEEINNKIYEVIEDNNKVLYLTLIISVDRITSAFNSFIKIKDAEMNLFKMAVGVSFGGNKIYIARDILDYNPCKRINKEIIEILELEEIKDK